MDEENYVFIAVGKEVSGDKNNRIRSLNISTYELYPLNENINYNPTEHSHRLIKYLYFPLYWEK